jgi:mRNA interferase RelE/StbE
MKVRLSKYADKYLKRLDKLTENRIRTALKKLEEEPPKGDIVPLKGHSKFFRLRIGGYRIIFSVEDNIIKVVEIDSRGQIYKDW